MADALDWVSISTAIYNWIVSGSGLAADHVFWAYEAKPRPSNAPYIVMSIMSIRPIGHDWATSEQNTLVLADQTIASVNTGTSRITITGHPYLNGDGPFQLDTTGVLPAPLAVDTDYWVIVIDANTIQLASTFVHTGGLQPQGAANPKTPITLTTTGSGTNTVVVTGDTVRAGQEIIRRAQGFRELVVHFDCIAAEGKGYDAMRIMSNVAASLQLNLYALDLAGVGVADLGQAFSQGGIQSFEGHRGGILEPRSMLDLTCYLASNLTGLETIIESIDASIVLDSEGGTPLPSIPVHVDLT